MTIAGNRGVGQLAVLALAIAIAVALGQVGLGRAGQIPIAANAGGTSMEVTD